MATTARRRRRWTWLIVFAALVVLAIVGARVLLEPERMSAFLLRQASQATGLEITLAQPADVGWWPDLHLELRGLSAMAPGAASSNDVPASGARVALLRAERVETSLPWSSLWSDDLQIRGLRLIAPQVDLAAVQAWLATRARSASPATLPRVDAAIEVSDGRLAGDGWAVDHLALALPSLLPGTTTTLAFSGVFTRATRTWPIAGTLAARPVNATPGWRFDAVQLVLTQPLELTAGGSIDTDAPDANDASSSLVVSLDGALSWPAEWPVLPLPGDASGPLNFALDVAGDAWTFSLARGSDAIDIALRAGEFATWLDDPAATPIPPLTGNARAERLQFGTVELRGVELRIDDDDEATDGAR